MIVTSGCFVNPPSTTMRNNSTYYTPLTWMWCHTVLSTVLKTFMSFFSFFWGSKLLVGGGCFFRILHHVGIITIFEGFIYQILFIFVMNNTLMTLWKFGIAVPSHYDDLHWWVVHCSAFQVWLILWFHHFICHKVAREAKVVIRLVVYCVCGHNELLFELSDCEKFRVDPNEFHVPHSGLKVLFNGDEVFHHADIYHCNSLISWYEVVGCVLVL